MTNDQYIFSGSLPENASTYVTRQADSDLYAGLKAGKFCYVLNSRQSGKSSLRVRTMQRLREEGVQCAAIDLSAGGIQNVPPEQWYADLIDNLIETFDLDVDFGDWWEANQLNSLVTRFRKFLEEILLVEVQENIVIFIDEIDSVLSLKFPTDDFFALIRACYNKRVDNPEYNRLTFCLLGVASPSNLIEDKQRTPFNIGQAISLTGFQLHEIEPLARGMSGRFSHPQAVMEEILYWTGGQPFLTQKLCQLMIEESLQDNPRNVEQVVKSRIIENWESQDEPEHLRTIQARILRDEQRAGYLLELYQQIRLRDEQSEVTADDTLEQSELQLSGLVFRQQNNLRVYNPIYQEVFNQNWIDNQLRNLRPYSENFRFWVASEGKDTSRLLRGKALEEAEAWARDKSLSYQDRQFLAASKEQEIQEEIAAKEQEAALERERQDREAAEYRNSLLSEANRKAKQQIRNGYIILIFTVLVAAMSVILAEKKVKEAQEKLKETYTYVAYPQQLRELVSKLPPNSEAAELISEQIDIKIKDAQIEQVYLHAAKALAYQEVEDWKSAEESIKQSMNFLRGWKQNQEEMESRESNSEFLEIQIFALNVKGKLLSKQNNTQNAIEAYKEAFNILEKNPNIISLQSTIPKIIDSNVIESVHQHLIDILNKDEQLNKRDKKLREKVEQSLTQYLYAQLEYYLKVKNWQAADWQTDRLMLYLSKREEQRFLEIDNINNFSCPALKKIDQLWVANSDKRFGFSVQKEIWNKNSKNYISFAKAVGWYNEKIGGENLELLRLREVLKLIKKSPDKYRGSLPHGRYFSHTLYEFHSLLLLRLEKCNI
ncbi:TPR repeat-containing protein [Tolypothrix tenuis PCC 7101]|uniref:TPR repeat-containing protein n=1 Tax=Tolypothrix tenuis PCC 7101 TaxID=231146 RepID=A0A1Z4N670_9CYAN|nr:AAA-like domain-containing protein [Aulosira sp. FACHB-113]BAZ01191.1 TPR repeat-containing protein [Tolypothrix tenuis PCC 7101]BAZ74887.1 TPR repeat-containing protein [Aulosira laxa NIES-50]